MNNSDDYMHGKNNVKDKIDSSNELSGLKYIVKNNQEQNVASAKADNFVSEVVNDDKSSKYTVGDILSSKRKELSLSIDDVAGSLKIKPKYLDAIEKNNFSVLPGYTYAMGFIRSYSVFLNLDFEKIITIYKQQINNNFSDFEYEDNAQMRPLKTTSDLRNYFTILILISFILASIFFGIKLIVMSLSKKDIQIASNGSVNNDNLVTVIQDQDNKLNNDIKNTTPFPINKSNLIDEKDNRIYDNINNSEKGNNKTVVIDNKIYGIENKDASRVFIKATGTSWIKLKKSGLYVYDEEKGDVGTGSTIFEGTLYSGDVYYLPNYTDLFLTIGNAKYIDIYLDGNKLNALSHIDNTSKLNIAVSPEKLVSR